MGGRLRVVAGCMAGCGPPRAVVQGGRLKVVDGRLMCAGYTCRPRVVGGRLRVVRGWSAVGGGWPAEGCGCMVGPN